MKNFDNPSFKSVILRLIQQDFEMTCLHERLANVGFIGADFPSITFEIFDLIGIPEESRTDELFDWYDKWAVQLRYLLKDKKKWNDHLETVFLELSKFTQPCL